MSAESPARLPALFPREHGASVELFFALLTGLSLARPTCVAAALAAAAVLVFVAHEPLMVLFGRRGERRRVAQRVIARRMILALGAAAVSLVLLAAPSLAPLALAALAIPAALALPAIALALRGQERGMKAELLVVAALASAAIPVALASDAPLFAAIEAAAIWLVAFGAMTLAARGVLYRAKDRGDGLRLAIVVATSLATISVGVAWLGWLPLAHALAPLPSALIALVTAMRPPSPKQMARVGIGLTVASFACFTLLVL